MHLILRRSEVRIAPLPHLLGLESRHDRGSRACHPFLSLLTALSHQGQEVDALNELADKGGSRIPQLGVKQSGGSLAKLGGHLGSRRKPNTSSAPFEMVMDRQALPVLGQPLRNLTGDSLAK